MIDLMAFKGKAFRLHFRTNQRNGKGYVFALKKIDKDDRIWTNTCQVHSNRPGKGRK